MRRSINAFYGRRLLENVYLKDRERDGSTTSDLARVDVTDIPPAITFNKIGSLRVT
jgi:hypothetical protein